MAIAELPEILHEPLALASDKIGAERAVIALQAVAHAHRPLTLIDGVLRQETIAALTFAATQKGADTIRDEFVVKIEARFPGTFTPEPEVDETPVVAPRTRARRT